MVLSATPLQGLHGNRSGVVSRLAVGLAESYPSLKGRVALLAGRQSVVVAWTIKGTYLYQDTPRKGSISLLSAPFVVSP
jgi:hypothetical protein